MSIFAIADLHLSFNPDSEKPMDIFGSRWLNHPERIRENWCRDVNENDTVIVAGDISWGLKLEEAAYDLEWIDRLPGHKVIFKGNHDLWWNGITKMNTMYDTITFVQNDCYKIPGEDELWACGSRGWITPDDEDFTEADEKIYKREILRLRTSLEKAAASSESQKPEIIGFLHFPPVSSLNGFSGFMQAFEDFGVKEVYFGHVHGEGNFSRAPQGNFYGAEYRLISADYLNCQPLKIR